MPRSRTTALTGAALAATLVLGGCGSDDGDDASGKGDSGSGASVPEAKLLHRVPQAKVSELTGAQGMWTTERNFVKADLKKIVGYPLDGGKPNWQIPLDGEICWTSPKVSEDGFIAVVFENDKEDPATCTEVGLVDLKRGKLRWQKQAMEDGSAQMFDEVTIGGGTVAAGGTFGTAGWTLGGRQLWAPGSDERCPANAYAGEGDKLIAVRDCGDDVDNPQLRVETVNPRTRAATSTYAMPTGTEAVHVVSTDPLVLAADDGDAPGGSSISQFLTVDDSAARGKLLSRISTAGGEHGKYDAECASSEVTDCQQLAVSKETGKLFLGTQDTLDKDSDANNDLVAFDLKTGKRVGAIEGSDDGTLIPIGLDEGGEVLAYQQTNLMRERGGAVWRIDPTTYKKKQLMRNPDAKYKTEDQFEVGENRILYARGRLYLGSDHLSEPDSLRKNPSLAIIYGDAK